MKNIFCGILYITYSVQMCHACFAVSFQLARYTTEGLLQLGPLGSTTFLPDTKCLVDDGRGRTPSLKKCDTVTRSSQRLWDFTQVRNTCMHLCQINIYSFTHSFVLIFDFLHQTQSFNFIPLLNIADIKAPKHSFSNKRKMFEKVNVLKEDAVLC